MKMSSKITRRLGSVVLGAALVLMLIVRGAPGQSAPAGNEHPVAESAAARGEIERAFGPPVPTRFDLGKKEAFSKAVDLSAMRDLAVYHQGRVKILDTLARETVSTLMGRRDFVDLDVPAGGGKVRRVHYDQLFTYLDLAIDPGYYVDRPLIHVEYLPLREAFLERMYSDKDEIEWWKRAGRLKPRLLVEHLEGVEAKHAFEPAMRQGLERVRGSLLLYQDAWRDLNMVAPASESGAWGHISTLAPESEAGRAVKELGEAWRAGDAGRVNVAVRVLGEHLPKINAPVYPTARRGLEAAYNRVNAFELGYWMYALALLLLLISFGTGRRGLMGAGVGVLAIAAGLHAFGFISRCIIAERFAIQNQFESMTGVSLFAALVGIGLMIVRRQPLFGAAAAGVGFMVLLTATQTGIPGVRVEREAAILNTSVLLKYHVTTVLVSYGLIALGFMVSLFYLGAHYSAGLRARSGGAELAMAGGGAGSSATVAALGGGEAGEEAGVNGASRARVLGDLDKAHMIILQLAFWTLGVGILLGAWWADHSWGRWWAFDPKELWALVTWIVYLIVIHVRMGGLKDKGLTTAWLSVIGFIVMLWTYFGVNLLLPGLHAYA